jgi:hypothetical protein
MIFYYTKFQLHRSVVFREDSVLLYFYISFIYGESQMVYKDMTLHKITEFYTEWFSVYLNITSEFSTIVIFKNCVKQNNDSNKTCRYVHDLLQSSFV